MNISRTAFYSLVRMQNLLNDFRSEMSSLSDAMQKELAGSVAILTDDIQVLTTDYLDEVDNNRVDAAANELLPLMAVQTCEDWGLFTGGSHRRG